MKKWQIWTGMLVLVVTFATDRAIKIATALGYRANFRYIRWTLLHNYGAAGGILHGHRLFLIVVGVLVTLFLVWLPRILQTKSVVFFIGWGLALGGALGNLYDRVVHAYVIDMFQIHHQRGVFNLADMGINLGLALMVVTYMMTEAWRWLSRRRQRGSP